MYRSTKTFKEIGPCAYRNWKAKTDCYLLHGYCRTFHFEFESTNLDSQGFVVDFGDLDELKRFLNDCFDHTVILQADDPLVPQFRKLEQEAMMVVRTFPSISCEGVAEYLAAYVTQMLKDKRWYERGVRLVKTVVRENEKNSAEFIGEPECSFDDYKNLAKEMEAAITQA